MKNGRRAWGAFDKKKQQHRYILSLLYQLGWKTEAGYGDIDRLGGWLQSERSPVQKPLLDMDKSETSRIISAMEGMVKTQKRDYNTV